MAAKKAVFIERSGVLHHEFQAGMTGKPRELELETGVISALKSLDRSKFLLFFYDNPEGVALGRYSEAAYGRSIERLFHVLKKNRIEPDGNYTCLSHPQGRGKYRKESVFRFPNVGIFKEAQQEHDLDLSACWVIGDRTKALLAGQRALCRTILVKTGIAGSDREFFVEPDLIAENLKEAMLFVREQELALTR